MAGRNTSSKKNLLLAFDAFGTLFTPKEPIAKQYGDVARKHGLTQFTESELEKAFKNAYKQESKAHPNYGKASGMGATAWWSNVISNTFKPFLSSTEPLPKQLVPDLLTRFTTHEGYRIFPDVLPFFQHLRQIKSQSTLSSQKDVSWHWNKTIVGIITNSDDRVPDILRSFGMNIGRMRAGSKKMRREESASENDISFVVLSYDVGCKKPDRRMFDAAKSLLKDVMEDESDNPQFLTEQFEYLYVGDEWEKDYVAARKAGWNSLFLDRQMKYQAEAGKAEGVFIIDRQGDSGDGKPLSPAEVINDLRALREWRPRRS